MMRRLNYLKKETEILCQFFKVLEIILLRPLIEMQLFVNDTIIVRLRPTTIGWLFRFKRTDRIGVSGGIPSREQHTRNKNYRSD
jgi:hypothetical protein